MRDEFSKNTGLMSGDGMMSEPFLLQENGGLISSAADSPARISALPDRGLESMGSDRGCGVSSRESLAFFDLATSSWKTWQTCLFGGLIEFSGTYPCSGTMQNGRLYRRAQWVRHTCVRECSFIPTPTALLGRKGWGIGAVRIGKGRRYPEQTIRNALKIGEKPSPVQIEIAMGFPAGWTDLDA